MSILPSGSKSWPGIVGGFIRQREGNGDAKKPWNGGRSEPEIVCLAVPLSRQRLVPTVCVGQIMSPVLFEETSSNVDAN